MNKKHCLFDERYSMLTDIIVNVSIAHYLIKNGYIVHWPVDNQYHFHLLKDYIKIDGLIWYSIHDDKKLNEIPYFKDYYDDRPIEERKSVKFANGDLYLSVMEDSQRNLSSMVMANKLFWARNYLGMEFGDWRKLVPIERNYEREQQLIDTYNLYEEYMLISNVHTYTHKIDVNINNKKIKNIHTLDHNQDWSNGFNAFDWIGALENAKEIHAVNSLIAILADKYCLNNKIYLYDRFERNNWHSDAAFIWRNPNWILR